MPKKPFSDAKRGLYSGLMVGLRASPRPGPLVLGLDPRSKLVRMTAAPSPAEISGTITGAGICTSTLVTMTAVQPPDATNHYWWYQISGPPMTVDDPFGQQVRFSGFLTDGGSATAEWGCTVSNDYGQQCEAATVVVALGSSPSYVPMSVVATPPSETIVWTDASGDVFVSFSVAVTNGEPPYTYAWGGGPGDGTPYNYANFHLDTPGGALDFAPGCVIHDNTGASIGAAPGPFILVRPL